MVVHAKTQGRAVEMADSNVVLRQKQLSDIRMVDVASEHKQTFSVLFTDPRYSYPISEDGAGEASRRHCFGETITTPLTPSVPHKHYGDLNLGHNHERESNKQQFATVKTISEISQTFQCSSQPSFVAKLQERGFALKNVADRSAQKTQSLLVAASGSNSSCTSECEHLQVDAQLALTSTKTLTIFILAICTVSLSGNLCLVAMVSTDTSMTSTLKTFVMADTAADVAILISTMCILAWLSWNACRRISPQENMQNK